MSGSIVPRYVDFISPECRFSITCGFGDARPFVTPLGNPTPDFQPQYRAALCAVHDSMLPLPTCESHVNGFIESLAARDESVACGLARLRPFLPPVDRRAAVVPHDRQLMIGQEAKALSVAWHRAKLNDAVTVAYYGARLK